MVFVKVRETYDLHTVPNKMTVIAIHTPKPAIIKDNFPGLLMNTKMYRPFSCDVTVACASMLPLDPQGVGTSPGDVSPEDVFNPILYSAMSNKGMSQLESRINYLSLRGTNAPSLEVDGNSASIDIDSFVSGNDDFDIYYGILSNSHGWKKSNPQSGLTMRGLKPLVYDLLYNVGDSQGSLSGGAVSTVSPGTAETTAIVYTGTPVLGNAHPMPFLNNTQYTSTSADPGFSTVDNHELDVPWLNVTVGAIIVPPSRLSQLYYRMVVEWVIEFSAIRPLSEIVSIPSLGVLGQSSHYRSYDYSETKEAVTGTKDTIFESEQSMVSANVDVTKVM